MTRSTPPPPAPTPPAAPTPGAAGAWLAASDAPAPRPGPQSPMQLFWVCTGIALQGFGGVVAVVQREIVERRGWLTPTEFAEDWAVAQTLPGANVVNLTMMLGSRHFGLRGACAAVAGMLALPALVLVALMVIYGGVSTSPAVQGALRGIGAVAAGLIAATALKMLPTLRTNPLGPWLGGALALSAWVGVALFKMPLLWLLATLGLASCALAYWRLGHRRPAPGAASAAASSAASSSAAASASASAPPSAPAASTAAAAPSPAQGHHGQPQESPQAHPPQRPRP